MTGVLCIMVTAAPVTTLLLFSDVDKGVLVVVLLGVTVVVVVDAVVVVVVDSVVVV